MKSIVRVIGYVLLLVDLHVAVAVLITAEALGLLEEKYE